MKFSISFVKTADIADKTVITLGTEDGAPAGFGALGDVGALYEKAAATAGFKAEPGSALDLISPAECSAARLFVLGLGKAEQLSANSFLRAGGKAAGLAPKAKALVVFPEAAGVAAVAGNIAEFALGMMLGGYNFDRFKTTGRDDEDEAKEIAVEIVTSDPVAAEAAFAERQAIGEGVILAREMVNLPANILGPREFADKARELESLGARVELLDEAKMRELGMGALLGVAQGSVRPPYLAVIEWNGGSTDERPIAFVGKGVVFDTGGISIKPAASMEDMKGDMGGAAAVIGLMHTLAARKAKVNAVGILGLVENMPDGNAQRPGDIVTSMSGQTIEVINTDAEGRLVLADALFYCNQRFKPRFMIDLATLTGAVMVALGAHRAGLFSNDDGLSAELAKASETTDEKIWRLPLGEEYDRMVDSRFADMRNTGGSRHAGSITAAQFLKRFVGETPWAHLDIAGTAMGAPKSEINRGWASGFGVRLLDELVRSQYEARD
ncbi:leucyl aminopeptidase [Martelella radicis]|uniref:Probable cytosol aminopeptidase n=1 Tax=Martelella radicis TaxID=1397476 RepID=A0A7W6KHY7_9HYPH|nr:leucyl aminopeptidase [Martelella radicis]MBB4120544.1 leucyl aminopeptidase [Martelella radicis]